MYILGLNIGHDATATLIRDGKIVSAIAEERVSRVKFHFGFPYGAIKECLRTAKADGKDVKRVVLSFENDLNRSPFHYTDLIIYRSGTIDPSNEIDNRKKFDTAKEIIFRKMIGEKRYWKMTKDYAVKHITGAIKKCGIENFTLSTAEHHLCHAASAYYEGGKNEALIVTMDGAGDNLSATVSIGRDGKIDRLSEIEDIYSVGRFYSAITKFLGFKRNRHEGKITGLAAYGDERKLYDTFKQLIDITEDKKSFYCPLAGDDLKNDKLRKSQVRSFLSGKYYGHNYTNLYLDFLSEKCIDEKREDVAAAAQKLTEDLVVEYISGFVETTKIYDIVLAGGLFANVKVNQRVLEIEGVKSVFIHPNMGDGGTATGAAYVEHSRHLESKKQKFMPFTIENVYYGPEFNDDEILESLKRFDGLEYRKSDDIVKETAEMIKNKTVVGWFQGRMEYGPRALGNRSILFDPGDKKINDWLNKRLRRTEFMPFAPSGIFEEGETVFKNFSKGEYPSYFITI
ncbi:MAG: carbamoyltransferase N-terminal domain-containing protein, partial [bacterium]|nr:carbamoyltransferase N-terminal domain-containing protein [bacterium]